MSKYVDDGAEVSGEDSGDDGEEFDDLDHATAEDLAFIDDEENAEIEGFSHASVDQLRSDADVSESIDVEMAEAIAAIGTSHRTCPACANPQGKRAHAPWCVNRVRSSGAKRKMGGGGRGNKKKRAVSSEASNSEAMEHDPDNDGADDADGASDGPQDILRKLHPSTYIERYSSVFSPYPLCYMNKPQDAKRIASMNWMQSKITERMNSFVGNPGAQDDLLWRVSRPMRAFHHVG